MNNHRSRYEYIAETLARHGLGFLAGWTGLDRFVPFHHGAFGHERREEPYRTAEHLRLALEELGPTFIKLGQLLSTRPDLVPPEYAEELAKLQDSAPPVPLEDIREAIRQELGAEPEQLFAEFDPEPLAAASIGQAHTAMLSDGTAVVVKVRRPGVVAQIEEDLDILQNLAVRAARRWELASDYDLPGIAQEFAASIRAEVDYLREGRTAERFAANFAGTDVTIPRIFWDTSTSRVLTMERMRGIKIDDLAALDRAGIDRKVLAQRGADVVLKMIFDDRFFHADPHPGNMFVQSDATIALIDFGMIGEVGEELQEQLTDFLIAFTRGDADGLGAALVGLSVRKELVDRERLRASLTTFVSLYHGRSLGEISMGQLMTQLLNVLREQHLQLPAQVAALFKVLIMIEGIGVRLDPDFDLVEALTPYSKRLLQQRLSLLEVAKRLAGASADAGELLVELPGRLRRLLAGMDSTGIQVHLRAAELEPLVGRTERIGNRLVAGMVAAALINGVGGLVAGDRRWRSWENAMIGVGVSVAGALSGYLLWTARRRRG
ncbi:AarF/ABC1/UbiB kinase family protein [Mycetocola manganoxydans]|uniref:AarF/ABC1/UbiB kinase family protein n=1 Tax=Mycetocola manganoxydans TaxID=699879 RepID=A0A3L6ZU19_9MICO|nr:AarF/ABC1/UbiB kinase family protein [Mycetocola manganoxydans]RLP71384.1 AarF/ABC1/UbiB kinase family protein [Mycetocola manganoxydans]GHD46155.1 ubiquinone biosynthesis protein UbiB [Mycetocola manganoxydans]